MAERTVRVAIFVRDGARCRLGANKSDIPAEVRVPLELRRALPHVDPLRFQGLDHTSKPEEFLQRCGDLDNKIIGVAVLRTLYVEEPTAVMTRLQMQIRQFWQMTKYSAFPLVWFEVCAAFHLVAPFEARPSVLRTRPGSFFFEVTPFSSARLWGEQIAGGLSVEQQLRQTCQEQRLPNPDEPINLAWVLSAPHALMIAHGQWRSHGYPLLSGPSARVSGINPVGVLHTGLELEFDEDAVAGIQEIGPYEYQDQVDVY